MNPVFNRLCEHNCGEIVESVKGKQCKVCIKRKAMLHNMEVANLRRGVEVTLTLKDLISMGKRCAITQLELEFTQGGENKMKIASIDRINSKGGYTPRQCTTDLLRAKHDEKCIFGFGIGGLMNGSSESKTGRKT
jgi:hypothetical protein